MRYMVEDCAGHVFPIEALIDRNGNKTEDLKESVSIVVKIEGVDYIPEPSETNPFMIYTVH